jgi:hypothetical protein
MIRDSIREQMRIHGWLVVGGILILVMILPLVALTGQTKVASSVAAHQSATQAEAAKPRGPEPNGLVPKYGIVWQGKLTRSGMPKNDDGWKWLRAQGINSIVNFRARNDVDYKKYGFEDSLWIPMDNGRLPTEAEAETYLAWIQNPANQPVHIQCAEGKDRTGMMAALARYAIEGWSIEDAIKETSLYRKGETISVERISWLREWASKHPSGSQRKK